MKRKSHDERSTVNCKKSFCKPNIDIKNSYTPANRRASKKKSFTIFTSRSIKPERGSERITTDEEITMMKKGRVEEKKSKPLRVLCTMKIRAKK